MEELQDPDKLVYDYILKHDDNVMLPPGMDEGDILISKVRRTYYDHLMSLLLKNYEASTSLRGKNIHIPSALWRCAKHLEMEAAQNCMLLQLYRTHICKLTAQLKKDTKNKKLNKKLFEHLNKPNYNDKSVQVDLYKVQEKLTSVNMEPVQLPIINQSSSVKQVVTSTPTVNNVATSTTRLSTESRDFDEDDEVFHQMEEMFRDANNDSLEDIFDFSSEIKPEQNQTNTMIKSLDDRLAVLENTGILPQIDLKCDIKCIKASKDVVSEWLCESYYYSTKLSEAMELLRETDRRKHTKVKSKIKELITIETDDDEMVSPIDNSDEFILSCKKRIAPHLVKYLTLHYSRGHIATKHLFKAVCRHIMDTILLYDKHPEKTDINCAVEKFFKTFGKIRCLADFQVAQM